MMEIFAKEGAVIDLGRWDENLARCVVFDVGGWIKTYGQGTVQLLHQRCGDAAPYPCVIATEGGLVKWTVAAADVAAPGRGQAELQYFVGQTRVKSALFHTRVLQSLGKAGPVPDDPAQGWVGQVLEEVRALEMQTTQDVLVLAQAGTALQERVTVLEEKAADASELDALEERAAALEKKDKVLAENDAALAQADAALDERTAALERQVADILYEPIRITSFSHNTGVKEMGDTITKVDLTWAISKTPVTLMLDGQELDVDARAETWDGLNITMEHANDVGWTLAATDERGTVSERSTPAFSFANGIYYGAAAYPEHIDPAFIMGLAKKELSNIKNRTVSVTGGDGLFAWYAYPKRLGTSLFSIGGFDYEYDRYTVSFTNNYGFTEDYYVYRSGQYAPASLSVTVKNGE